MNFPFQIILRTIAIIFSSRTNKLACIGVIITILILLFENAQILERSNFFNEIAT